MDGLKILLIENVMKDLSSVINEGYLAIEQVIRNYQVKVSYADLDNYENLMGYLTSTNNKPHIVINGNKSESQRKFALIELFTYAFLIGYEKDEKFKELSNDEVIYSNETEKIASTRIASEIILPSKDFEQIHKKLKLLYEDLPEKMMDFLMKESIKKAYEIPEKAYLSYL